MTHSEGTNIIQDAVTVLQNGAFMEQTEEVRALIMTTVNLRAELGSIYKPLEPAIENEVLQFQRSANEQIEYYRSGESKKIRSTVESRAADFKKLKEEYLIPMLLGAKMDLLPTRIVGALIKDNRPSPYIR